MKTVIKASVVHPVASPQIENGYVMIADGEIIKVGKQEELSNIDYDRVADLSGHILLPGFVNAHSHLHLTGMRGKIEYDGSFPNWIKKVIDYVNHTSPAEKNGGIRNGIGEMIRSGITAVADIVPGSEYGEVFASSPIESVLFLEAISPREADSEKTCQLAKEELERLKNMGIAQLGISPHAPHTVSGGLFRLLKKMADDMQIPIASHLAETEEENEYVRYGKGPMAELLAKRKGADEPFSGYGISPTALIDSYGALDNLLAVHLNIIDENDITLLKRSGAVPVFCPGSSRWFNRKKVLPIDILFEMGLKPALGTDSLASNSSLSMLDELRAAKAYFPNIEHEKLIEMATVNGAEPLGLKAGALEKGRQANLIAFKIKGNISPIEEVFNAEKADFVFMDKKRRGCSN